MTDKLSLFGTFATDFSFLPVLFIMPVEMETGIRLLNVCAMDEFGAETPSHVYWINLFILNEARDAPPHHDGDLFECIARHAIDNFQKFFTPDPPQFYKGPEAWIDKEKK